MSNEEIERKMAFIVEQQALFASDIQRLQESQARPTSHSTRLASRLHQRALSILCLI